MRDTFPGPASTSRERTPCLPNAERGYGRSVSDASGESNAFGVEVERNGTIRLCGELDIAVVPELEAAFASHDLDEPMVIDMSSVSFMDSSGLRCLLAASEQASDHSTYVALVDVGPEVTRLLEITGTIDWFALQRAGAGASD